MVRIRLTDFAKSALEVRDDIVDYKEIKNKLKTMSRDEFKEVLNGCSFDFPKENPPERSARLVEIENRKKEREYQDIVKNIKGESNRENFSSALSVGTSMISILLFGAASGYFLGKYIFGWEEQSSLILGFIITVISLYTEVILYVVRTNK